jgi:hypothetical protein
MQQEIPYEEMPWMDIYSKPDFQGKLKRFRPRPLKSPSEIPQTHLRSIGSIVVGPRVVAELHLIGKSQPIRLKSGTILMDASRRLNGGRVHFVLLFNLMNVAL